MKCENCIAYHNICEANPDWACEKFQENLNIRLALMREMYNELQEYAQYCRETDGVANKGLESILTRYEEMEKKGKR